MQGIAGKTVIVTGAARGIGKAIANRFSKEKAQQFLDLYVKEVRDYQVSSEGS